MSGHWRWAAARAVGTSHVKSGLPCQDYAVSETIETPHGAVMACIVSDGAGSAIHSQIGSKAVCVWMLKCARQYLSHQPLSLLTEEAVHEWIDITREFIGARAAREGARPRDFAATLVGALISDDLCVILHVGDGAAVISRSGSETWEVPSWPYQGEYASTTAFVTDDPHARLVFTAVHDRIDRFAVFSDGIERLVLEASSKTAHGPFFNRMVAPLLQSEPGSNSSLSEALKSYLESPNVCERTDDDKTLVLGVRQ